jgi:hypothetical protein
LHRYDQRAVEHPRKTFKLVSASVAKAGVANNPATTVNANALLTGLIIGG